MVSPSPPTQLPVVAPANLSGLACVDDVEHRARELLPRGAVGYYWGGTADERTVDRNRRAFDNFLIRPFTLRDVSRIDTSVHLNLTTNNAGSRSFTQKMAFPLGIAPTAFQCMAHGQGEKATARAAARTGTIMICSSFANFSFEEIAASVPNDAILWHMISMCKDRTITERLMTRAIAAGARALVVTGDPITDGRIRNNVRNGFVLPSHLRVPNFEEYIIPKNDATIDANVDDMASNLRAKALALIDDALTWEKLEWFIRLSPIPVLLKGVMRPEDAERAIQAGVSGIIVSNLGGRSMDHAPATIEALAEISATVKGRIPLFMDGGIRTGTDIFKAIALGAQMVFIGRPVLFGLAVAGEEGVVHVIRLLRKEFENAMKLSGCTTIAQIQDNRRQMVCNQRYYAKF